MKAKDRMNLKVEGPCPTTLEGLLVRTHPDWKLEVHIDTDEANCCDLTHATKVTLVKASLDPDSIRIDPSGEPTATDLTTQGGPRWPVRPWKRWG